MAWLGGSWVLLWFWFALLLGPVILLPWMFVFLICETTQVRQVVSGHLALSLTIGQTLMKRCCHFSFSLLVTALHQRACSLKLYESQRLTLKWDTIMGYPREWLGRLWRRFHWCAFGYFCFPFPSWILDYLSLWNLSQMYWWEISIVKKVKVYTYFALNHHRGHQSCAFANWYLLTLQRQFVDSFD